MTPHNNAKVGAIAPSILLPGDPLRAKFIAETFLTDVKGYNTVRNMLGFTGTYKGKSISVQGTGMGIPSASIYINELLETYKCKHLVRIGTAGAIHESIKVRDVILGTGASTDSAVNKNRFNGNDYAAVPSFDFALAAYNAAKKQNIAIKTGPIFSSDIFYSDDPTWYKKWAQYGVLAVDMEAAGLFPLTAKYNAHGLCLLTISDHIITGETTTAEERQLSFKDMMIIALDACVEMQEKNL